MSANPNILIFDFDGTIADTFAHTMRITNILSDEFHFKKVLPHEIEMLKGKTIQEIIKHLSVPIFKIPNIVAKAKSELNKDISSIEPISGLKQALPELKRAGVRMGILTSNSRVNVDNFLKANDLEIFDFIMTTSRIWGKNHGLHKMMQTENIKPEQILYIGDETRDIEAAQKAGVKVIAVTWGYNSHQILKTFQPDFIVHTPQELLALCASHLSFNIAF